MKSAFENIMLSARRQSQMIIHCIILYEISNTDHRDRKTSDAEDWGRGDGGGDGRAGLLAEGCRASFGMKMF